MSAFSFSYIRLKALGYVWFSENTKEKKNAKENDFFMFGCPIKNI